LRGFEPISTKGWNGWKKKKSEGSGGGRGTSVYEGEKLSKGGGEGKVTVMKGGRILINIFSRKRHFRGVVMHERGQHHSMEGGEGSLRIYGLWGGTHVGQEQGNNRETRFVLKGGRETLGRKEKGINWAHVSFRGVTAEGKKGVFSDGQGGNSILCNRGGGGSEKSEGKRRFTQRVLFSYLKVLIQTEGVGKSKGKRGGYSGKGGAALLG